MSERGSELFDELKPDCTTQADRAAAREQEIQLWKERGQQQTLEQIVNVPVHTQTGPHDPERGEKAEIPQAQYFDKFMDVPDVCQRQEPIITTTQKTVEVPQSQSEDQCRRVTSTSAEMDPLHGEGCECGVPGDSSQGTIAARQRSQTLLVQRVQMMTDVFLIQFIDESRRQQGQWTQRDVCTQGREPTLQGGMCPQAKLTDSVADCVAASQHSGTSTNRTESSA